MEYKKIAAVVGALLGGVAAPSWGLDSQDPVIQELLHKLEARDRLIADLQRRVAQLERMTGASASAPRAQRPLPPNTGSTKPGTRQGQGAKQPSAGQKRGAGSFEVDEEAAERALERTLTQTGALLLPFGQAEIQPFFVYTRQSFDFIPANPVHLVSLPNGQAQLGKGKIKINEFDSGVFFRLGLVFDSQLELRVPYTIVDRSISDFPASSLSSIERKDSASRLGDIQLGLAKTLFREKGWRPDLITRLTWTIPSGRRSEDGIVLGGGHHRLRGSVTMLKRQDPLAFTGRFFYEGVFDRHDDNPGDRFGFSIGALLAASPETSLSLSLEQTFIDQLKINGRTIRGSDRVVSSVVLGASTILGRGFLLSVSGAIGLTDDSPDYFVSISIPLRFNVPFAN